MDSPLTTCLQKAVARGVCSVSTARSKVYNSVVCSMSTARSKVYSSVGTGTENPQRSKPYFSQQLATPQIYGVMKWCYFVFNILYNHNQIFSCCAVTPFPTQLVKAWNCSQLGRDNDSEAILVIEQGHWCENVHVRHYVKKDNLNQLTVWQTDRHTDLYISKLRACDW